MNVGQVCSRQVVSVPTSAPLTDVARLLCDAHVGSIVVTKTPSARPVVAGMITDRDIMRVQLDATDEYGKLRAEDVMSRLPLEFSEHTPLEDVIRRMRERDVRRAPVISTDGALVGVVSTDDLVCELAREVGALARVVERQAGREAG